MFKLSDLINQFKRPNSEGPDKAQLPSDNTKTSIKRVPNWYEERFDNIIVQRNLLLVLLLIVLCLSIVAVGAVAYVINNKRFDPFVIQIDDSTGIAKVVNPINSSVLSGNQALAQYFIKKYVIARETYNPVDFENEAMKTVRLLSTNSIYWSFRGYLSNNEINPVTKYGQKNTTFLIVKSWSKLTENKYILRFSINETAGNKKVFNKIAVVEFNYLPMELTEDERDINPIGFQVIGYRVDDDNS